LLLSPRATQTKVTLLSPTHRIGMRGIKIAYFTSSQKRVESCLTPVATTSVATVADRSSVTPELFGSFMLIDLSVRQTKLMSSDNQILEAISILEASTHPLYLQSYILPRLHVSSTVHTKQKLDAVPAHCLLGMRGIREAYITRRSGVIAPECYCIR
jgi:hypothetical protein